MNTCARQQRLRNPLDCHLNTNCLLSKTNKTFLFIWISTVSSLQALLLLCVSEKIFFRVNNNPKWMQFTYVQQIMINNIYVYIVHVCHNICIHTYIHYFLFYLFIYIIIIFPQMYIRSSFIHNLWVGLGGRYLTSYNDNYIV